MPEVALSPPFISPRRAHTHTHSSGNYRNKFIGAGKHLLVGVTSSSHTANSRLFLTQKTWLGDFYLEFYNSISLLTYSKAKWHLCVNNQNEHDVMWITKWPDVAGAGTCFHPINTKTFRFMMIPNQPHHRLTDVAGGENEKPTLPVLFQSPKGR